MNATIAYQMKGADTSVRNKENTNRLARLLLAVPDTLSRFEDTTMAEPNIMLGLAGGTIEIVVHDNCVVVKPSRYTYDGREHLPMLTSTDEDALVYISQLFNRFNIPGVGHSNPNRK